MTMAEYLRAARMTDDERKTFFESYDLCREAHPLPFTGEDYYDANGHHEEYGGARH